MCEVRLFLWFWFRQSADACRAVNLGKWILENLFQRFIREEERAHAWRLRNDHPQRSITNSPSSPPPPFSLKEPANDTDAAAGATRASSVVVVAHNMLPALVPNRPIGLGISHQPFPHVPAPTLAQLSQALGSHTALGSSESTPQLHLQPQRAQTEVPATATATEAAAAATPKGQDYFSQVSSGEGGAGAAPTTSEEVSGVGTGTGTGTGPGAGSNAGAGGGGNGPATPGTAGGGFMGKLRGLGRTTKRAHGESTPGTPAATPRASGSVTPGPGTAFSAPATAPSNTPVCPSACT